MKIKCIIFVLIIAQIFQFSFGQIRPSSLHNNLTHFQSDRIIPKNYKLNESNANTIPTTPNSPSTITDNVDVRIFPSTTIQSEVHISVNRINPNNVIASCNTIFPNIGFSDFNQGHYFTTDGGLTWQGDDILQNSAGVDIEGDPSTAFSSNGSAYISTMTGFSPCNGQTTIGYLTQSSTNQGLTWTGLTAAANNGCFDKEMIGIDDQPGSAFANNIYGAWTNFTPGNIRIQFNRSINNGNTYSLPITISNSIGQGANVQTGPTGQVYVCWADYNNNETGARGLGFCRSLNGGVTFTNSQRIFNYSGIRNLNTNTDGSSPTFNNTRINDFPAMSVDKSNGIHGGRIYVTYAAHENGNGKAIVQVAWSDNQGDTWSNPVTVSIPTGRQNWFPWIAVDNCNGEIWVDYYSFDTPSGFGTNTYVAHSVDGGLNWENQRVSDVNHITQSIIAPNIAAGYAGDYIGITAFGGRAYPIWMDNRNGTWQLYCSPVTSNLNSYSIVGDNSFCTTSANYTIPNLPAGATVQWNATPTGIATINSPNSLQTTLTKISNGIVTLSATVSNTCGVPIIVEKTNIAVGTPTPLIAITYFGLDFRATASVIPNATYNWYFNNVLASTHGGTYLDGVNQCGVPNTLAVEAINTCGISAKSTKIINIKCGPRLQLSVFPNPGSNSVDLVTLDNTSFQKVRIYDKLGGLWKELNFPSGTKKATLNISDLPTDIYQIQVFDGNKWKVISFSKL